MGLSKQRVMVWLFVMSVRVFYSFVISEEKAQLDQIDTLIKSIKDKDNEVIQLRQDLCIQFRLQS